MGNYTATYRRSKMIYMIGELNKGSSSGKSRYHCGYSKMDLFTREQYIAWNGHESLPDWAEVTPWDMWLV